MAVLHALDACMLKNQPFYCRGQENLKTKQQQKSSKPATQNPSVPVFDRFFALIVGGRGLFLHRVNPVALLHPVLLHLRQDHSLCRDVPGLVLLPRSTSTERKE